MNDLVAEPGVAAVPPARRLVVDALTRTFHWLMALCFTCAYITAESDRWQLVHVTAGYTLAILLVLRWLWGMLGPRRVHPGRHWTQLMKWRASQPTSPGLTSWQAPALALGIVMVWLSIPLVFVSGYTSYMAFSGDWMEEIHEFAGHLMLWAVLVHVSALGLWSLLRRRHLAIPMITGRVRGQGPNLVRHNLMLPAVALLVLVLVFWSWQWRAGQDQQMGHGTQWSAWMHPADRHPGKPHAEDAEKED